MKLLIMDDNKEITDLFLTYFKSHGHDCYAVNDGRSGAELLERERYDAVILDLAMPEFTGFDVIHQLEKKHMVKNQNIIILTASGVVTDEQVTKLKNQGVKTVLRKPVSMDTLNMAIMTDSRSI